MTAIQGNHQNQDKKDEQDKQSVVRVPPRITTPFFLLGDDVEDSSEGSDECADGGQRLKRVNTFSKKLDHLLFLVVAWLVCPTFVSGVVAGLLVAIGVLTVLANRAL